ncbi:MAG: C39 family peptidase [Candidatus Moranbacteria bacterium]|nr:C39 family peptidase [Candidatus Moranbacteria bacterium]
MHIRRDVALSRLSPAENISSKTANNSEIVSEEIKNNNVITEPSSASSDAKALADKKATAGEATKILIDVPFTSQAPFGKWDAYHEEACEEASLVMLDYFLQNKKLTPVVAEKEIQALIAYEIKFAKGYEDSTVAQTATLGENYYGLKNLRVVYDFTAEDLKKYLSQGKPIIVPAAGRRLGNPNFTAPGPLYHNLVLIGYDGDTIITNDPGTRKGQGYRYNIKTLYGAIYDFPGDAKKIETGRKAMIVVE